MPFQRSLEIEQRLDQVLALIGTGEYSTAGIAEHIGVSIPTVSRCIQALRDRGHSIRAEREPQGWRYYLAQPPATKTPDTGERPLSKPR